MTDFFLLPGPTNVPQRVLAAGARPMVNHRGPEFMQMIKEITKGLQQTIKTDNSVLTLTCSGTGAMEAAVANFVNRGDKVLVASVGNFGDRWRDICATYGADIIYLGGEWGAPIDPIKFAQILQKDEAHEIKAVFCQLNETSTGILNPIKDLAGIKKSLDHPALLIVDAISGLAAAELEADEWGLDVVVAGSQKAFMSPPGLAFISVSLKAWQAQQANTQPKYYFDLAKAASVLAKGQTPYTPGIATAFAVAEALKMIEEQGLDNIIAAHAQRSQMVRAAVRAMGLSCVAPDDYASPAVTAVYAPKQIPSSKITAALRDRYNIVIAGGQGKFKDQVFRIGHLGEVSKLELAAVLNALEIVLNSLGFFIPSGTAASTCASYLK